MNFKCLMIFECFLAISKLDSDFKENTLKMLIRDAFNKNGGEKIEVTNQYIARCISGRNYLLLSYLNRESLLYMVLASFNESFLRYSISSINKIE